MYCNVMTKRFFIFFTMFFSLLCMSTVKAQTEALEAGVQAMGRGHYATALRAFRNLAKTGDAQAGTILATCMKEDLEFHRIMGWP